MEMTIGKRISNLRREKGLRQEDLAEIMNVSGQAVSKWENDQTCPDISLLPLLAKTLGVSVDELLSGEKLDAPVVAMQEKNINDMMLRIVVDSKEGDKVRVNLPMALIQLAVDKGIQMTNVTNNNALNNIDLKDILALVKQGVVGNLVDVESAQGETVRVFVE